jgi:sec-independent protein translocase protein TatA
MVVAMFGVPGPDMIIVAVVALVLFGTSKVGTFFKSLGEGVKEFKKAATDEPETTTVQAAPVASAAPLTTPAETPQIESKVSTEPAGADAPSTKE